LDKVVKEGSANVPLVRDALHLRANQKPKRGAHPPNGYIREVENEGKHLLVNAKLRK
jgi:hypothetical protein